MALNSRKIGLILGPLAFVLIRFFFEPIGLVAEAIAVLAVTAWVSIWWITEAVQIEVTSLLPILLLPLSGGLPLESACASYGHKYIFLFVGGFILAIAIEKWNLHKRIALNIIDLVGTNQNKIILGFMISTAFLSMWISNTATAVMMLPIGMAIVKQVEGGKKKARKSVFGRALMLAIAYSASIGGIATLIGTPPNLILAGILNKSYGIELSFFQWFMVGFPLSILLLLISWKYLTFSLPKRNVDSAESEKTSFDLEKKGLGKIQFEEKLVLGVFILTAFAWMSRSFLLKPLLPAIDDTIISLTAALLLFLLPSKTKGKKLIQWKDAVKLPWGILFIFGGGIAIAEAFQSSGLAIWIANNLSGLNGIHLFALLFILVAMVNFLTEITSNLATTAVLLPILGPLAMAMNVHPFVLMIGCTIAASCAFMLPVATPPNAIVFSSGYLKISHMVRAGIWMNLISIVVVTLVVYFVLPAIWDIDIHTFPELFMQK